MLKIIHCADLHLGSQLKTHLSDEKAKKRRDEINNTFRDLVEYAKNHEVKIVLLAGDVFDSDHPYKKDKAFFYDIIKSAEDIEFLYLKGNHDIIETYLEEIPTNLKCFSQEWRTYSYEKIAITGIEISNNNSTSLYSTLNLEKEKMNIVMLHGQISNSQSGGNLINLSKLKDKHIDYMALGHIHSYDEKKLDNRGSYGYSGCLEGRGFDEIGEKGFVLLTVGNKIEREFIPFSKRIFVEQVVDITNINSINGIIKKVESEINAHSFDIVRVILTGEVNPDIADAAFAVEKAIEKKFYFTQVKDKTIIKFDVAAYEGDFSLKGEFIRTVLANRELTAEQKSKIISFGIKALSGEEV